MTSASECLQTAVETKVASGSDDATVKLWDVTSGECLQTLEAFFNCVFSSGTKVVVFSRWDEGCVGVSLTGPSKYGKILAAEK